MELFLPGVKLQHSMQDVSIELSDGLVEVCGGEARPSI